MKKIGWFTRRYTWECPYCCATNEASPVDMRCLWLECKECKIHGAVGLRGDTDDPAQ